MVKTLTIEDEIALREEYQLLLIKIKALQIRKAKLEEELFSRRTQAPFKIGDIVRITNEYKGEKGTEGAVIKITEKTVTLQPRGEKLPIQRHIKNVEKVTDLDDRDEL